ncbi:S1 RNA-binding domain-containing protein [Occallatibacter riparius]|uniref:S1 RNA-binding domain-containing protein n=1 Tax=Occallatibacter riparius TaxID=1002689 RepID=A0A9J7BQI6_9BACT|nr:S1 RNA-binding domain-containing protein [Occallatibacter riparius]UWZ85067.1 S1 RNA-binding domain-containing protein [Occallatibacter riparius]
MTENTNPETEAPESTSAPITEPAAESLSEPAAEPTTGEALATAPSYEVVNTPVLAGEAAPADEPMEDFGALLADYEKSHKRKSEAGPTLQGTVVSITPEQVFLDIGYKIEGVLPRAAFEKNADGVQRGDMFPVSITGRNEEGYYQLSRFKVAQPKDWSALQAAFDQKLAVSGTVTEVVKGGARVDVGVRAFMPASRSGTRDAAELETLVGQQITCRITKLDVADEDVVVDRRVVLEEQALAAAGERFGTLKEGDVVSGTVRTLMPYGAFIDLGGIDGLLHVSDIAWTRISKPEDVLSVGDKLDVKILKIDPNTKKLSLGLKQLQQEPWETVPQRYQAGQRVSGTVTRVQDFGAFVEIEPGVEGLIHVSEMSWGKKVRIASDILKPGERVDAVILNIKPEEKRISLGLKQTLTDPWTEVAAKFPVGSQVQGPVTKLMAFGAFVQIAEGVEGMVHISEIVADRRLNHPSDALRVGQTVQAQVLAIDTGKRQIKLSMKQLIPTSIDEYIAEHKVGDKVSGRVVAVAPATVELGEGIIASCRATAPAAPAAGATSASAAQGKADLSSLSSMLSARWKGAAPAPDAKPQPLEAGQVRSFKITKLDAASKQIEVELA